MAVDLQAPRVRLVKEWQFDVAHGFTTVGEDLNDEVDLPAQPAFLTTLLGRMTFTDVAKGKPNKYRAFCVQQTNRLYFTINEKTAGAFAIAVVNYTGDSVDLTGGTVKIIVQEYRSDYSR